MIDEMTKHFERELLVMNETERKLIDRIINILSRHNFVQIKAEEVLVQARMQEIDLGKIDRTISMGTIAEVLAEVVENELAFIAQQLHDE